MILQEFLKEITPSSIVAQQAAEKRWQQIAKPLNGLGHLEDILVKIASLTENQKIQLSKRCVVPLCADNGVVEEGITQTDKNVTAIVTRNFSRGKTSACIMAKSTSCDVIPVDIGVAEDLTGEKLIHHKISYGTKNFTKEPAMNRTQALIAILFGIRLVRQLKNQGYRLIATGEMGIGNTATASVLMSIILELPIQDCVGKGTGVNDEQLIKKISILKKCIANYDGSDDLDSKLAYFGGFEIMQMVGGMLQAKQDNMLILVDGFICSVAFLIAFKKNPSIIKNAIFCHSSAEQGHQKILDYLGVRSLLQLDLRLGEGTGCAIAFPIIESAISFLNDMASFESAGVSSREL